MIDATKLKTLQDCKGRIKSIMTDEEILSLCNDGIIPHYIITNPVTKQESVWFIASELNEWFDGNHIHYRESNFTPSYQFLSFDREQMKVTGGLPDELCKISDIYQLPMEFINTPPGIYFLCKDNKIQYIGQAKNVMNRITTHIMEGVKDFDAVYFITCPINRLLELESSLIRFYQPPLNKTCRIPAKDCDNLIVQSIHKNENHSPIPANPAIY